MGKQLKQWLMQVWFWSCLALFLTPFLVCALWAILLIRELIY